MNPTALRDLLISWANINSGSANLAGLARMRAALAGEFGRLQGAVVEHLPLEGTEGSGAAGHPPAERAATTAAFRPL
jgi:hypothetical protein